mmetsp:Transcript_30729/g.91267  ORF Transcript_30729/g.91267 Transcript_30729/m.91267 type:complete len:209 (-) Transcript_30729:883-1509(-)
MCSGWQTTPTGLRTCAAGPRSGRRRSAAQAPASECRPTGRGPRSPRGTSARGFGSWCSATSRHRCPGACAGTSPWSSARRRAGRRPSRSTRPTAPSWRRASAGSWRSPPAARATTRRARAAAGTGVRLAASEPRRAASGVGRGGAASRGGRRGAWLLSVGRLCSCGPGAGRTSPATPGTVASAPSWSVPSRTGGRARREAPRAAPACP